MEMVDYCNVFQAHQKYKFMESSLVTRRKRLKTQVPDIKSSLAMVKKLREKKASDESMDTQFLLSDQVGTTNMDFYHSNNFKIFIRCMLMPPYHLQIRFACG